MVLAFEACVCIRSCRGAWVVAMLVAFSSRSYCTEPASSDQSYKVIRLVSGKDLFI
jgi:hypothetical protein